MRGPGVEPIAVHTVRCSHAPCAAGRIAAAARRGVPGAPEVWGPEHWRDAVVLLVPVGAIPAIVAEAWRVGALLGFRASCEAGAILLGDILPDQVEAALEAIGARPWLRAMTPPVRLTADSALTADGHVTMRIARPQTGRDLYWVVRTQGEAEPLDVEAAMTELLHSPVKAAEALVYDPATRRDPPGVVIRVETHRAATMDRMVAAGLTIAVRGRRYRVEPVIAIGQRTHVIPSAGTAADLLHRAAAAAGRGRAGLHAVVLEATPADRAGAPTDGDAVARVLREGGRSGLGRGVHAKGGGVHAPPHPGRLGHHHG